MHYSGIIASLFCGFGMKHYALSNISEQYQDMVLDMVHMLASMSDLVIFFMVGENVILFAPYDNPMHVFWTILLIIIGARSRRQGAPPRASPIPLPRRERATL